ncbi:MAG: LamG-like jellyroll fold domain-containing protein, partial [Vicinamibacterales bacterium]
MPTLLTRLDLTRSIVLPGARADRPRRRRAFGLLLLAAALWASPAAARQTNTYLEFDGVDDHAVVADADDLSAGTGTADTPLSIELWFRPDAMGGKQNLVSKWLDGSNQEYRLYIAAGTLRFDLRDSSAQATASAYSGLALGLQGSWHHLAATYDGRGGPTAANGITLYVDGQAVSVFRENSAAYVAMENQPAPLQLGRESLNYKQYDGGLDEVRIWRALRSAGQIQAQMMVELAGSEPGLTAYWNFNAGTGTIAADGTANGHDATLVDGPAWMPGGPITPTVDQPAAFTSPAAASLAVSAAGSYTITTTGSPVPTVSLSGALPTGVSFTANPDGTATLSGTPAPGSTGTYPLTLTATNGVGSPAVQAFTLTVTQPPVITSAAAATLAAGVPGSFTIMATGFPTPALTASGVLPAGVTFTDNGNGTATLAGTPAPASAGAYLIVVSAANGGAPTTQNLMLTVTAPASITSAAAAGFQIGVAGTFGIAASGFPAPAISVTGTLPAGLSVTDHGNGTATLAGTPGPSSGGVYPVTVTAANGVGTPATQTLTISVTQAVAITSAPAAAFAVGFPGTFSVTATGFPVPALGASGALPAGVTFVDQGNGTATLGGTPAPGSGGVYPLVLSASNGGTPVTQNFTLTVQACTLTPASGALPAGQFGVPYQVAFTASGGAGHTFSVTGGSLPAGLTLAGSGLLSGTPASSGPFSFTVTVTDGGSCNTSSAYTLQVTPVAQDETFSNGVGNTQFSVGAGAPATPAVVVAGSVLGNDAGAGTLSAGPAAIVSANGGQVAMSSTGTFIYSPAPGFSGPADTFTYTLTDGSGLTDTAVVTIQMSGVIWYVNGGGPAGDGRSHNPFNSMTAASAAAQPGQVIYVHAGSPSGATTLKAGQTLWGAGAPFVLNGLSIPGATAPTLNGSVALADNSAVRAVAIHGGAGSAVIGAGLSGSESLTDVAILGGVNGLDLSGMVGTFTMTGGSIAGISSGAAVRLSGGTGTVTIGAAISTTSARSVDVQNRTGGTVTFTGPITDRGTGILLNANGGSALAFNGGLLLETGANAAFTATGGGSLTVTQDNVSVVNTILTTSGTALMVSHTDIGTAGLTFRTISAGTGSPTAGAGIILDTTGVAAANGGLTVTGTGAVSSGGIIRRKSGPDGSLTAGVGIALTATKAPAFNWLQMYGFDNSAIVGREVVGFLLTNSTIEGAGSTAGITEGPIMFGVAGPGGV